jgi:hypothetical protein
VIVIACSQCSTAVRVTGEHEELRHLLGDQNEEWYPDRYPCPKTGCSGRAEFMESIDPVALLSLALHDLTPQEAYAAFHGLGLPEERDCGPTAVRAALLQSPIKNVDVRLIKGSNRSVLYKLELEDGTILFLGSSSFGATVYRMTKLQSAVARLGSG